MIRYIYANDLKAYPSLRSSMFRDRAQQFSERLNWDVSVDEDGFETDAYDAINPLYIIWETPQGRHGGSMRVLPTTGPTMINEHFLHLTDGVRIESPFIWECTRFCLAPDAHPGVAGALMLAGVDFGIASGLSHSVGVYDARMIHIYRRLGWEPVVLGTEGTGREAISVGLWPMEPELLPRLAQRAGISCEVARQWYARAFGEPLAA